MQKHKLKKGPLKSEISTHKRIYFTLFEKCIMYVYTHIYMHIYSLYTYNIYI